MPDSKFLKWLRTDEQVIIHSVRTAVVLSLVGRMVRLPEACWAGITPVIVTQSTLGAGWTISRQRLIGTALSAAMGALLAAYFGANVAIFGAGVFILGVSCAWLHIERNAYRYAGITLEIVGSRRRSPPGSSQFTVSSKYLWASR
jgi:uncharacterized membrane protein YccC